MSILKKPFLLLILDGFGYRENLEHNAIANANAPCWKKLWKAFPHATLEASGLAVGLPQGQMGNSEVGHLNIGSGRVVYQELTRIDQAIRDKSFFINPVLCNELDQAKSRNANIHIMGLLSPGGVHSHENHIQAMIDLARQKNISDIYLHAFLDGRDTPPKSACTSLEKIQRATILTIMGRYYAMDRDNRTERTQQAFELLTLSQADFYAENAVMGLEMGYHRGETDEFIKPTVIKNKNSDPIRIKPDDLIIFMNFRADRARQLTQLFLKEGYSHFVSLTQYAKELKTHIAFKPQSLNNTLSAYLSEKKLTQFHLAETEKYAHVTFFFNGGIEKAYEGEIRKLVPSPKVATYDLQPEMSAVALTDELVSTINSNSYDFIVCNYANPDMVGHTGNYDAAIKAIETIDQCLEKILLALQNIGGEMILTADHGNAECMYDNDSHQPHTAHTCDPVPFVYIGRPAKVISTDNALCDIAPTILYLMGLEIPAEMTGKNILELEKL